MSSCFPPKLISLFCLIIQSSELNSHPELSISKSIPSLPLRGRCLCSSILHIPISLVHMGFGMPWKVTEIENAIFQDRESFGKEMIIRKKSVGTTEH